VVYGDPALAAGFRGCWPLTINVAIPEPASRLMLLAGVALIAEQHRRRKAT
jgi:hypothetical protein